MDRRPKPDAEHAALLRCFSPARLDGYLTHCQGDLAAALDLYEWNTAVSGALWEALGHTEIALRNALAGRLAYRHRRLRRPRSWLDDPKRELDQRARGEIADARRRVLRNRKPRTEGQVISELAFGFWRFLLARRYTNIWPDLAAAFPNAPNRSLETVEGPVRRLHAFRNRLAHHQRVWTEPVADRHADVLLLLGYIDPHLASWVDRTGRVRRVLAARPPVPGRDRTGRP